MCLVLLQHSYLIHYFVFVFTFSNEIISSVLFDRNYAILYPTQSEYKTARRLRCSPLYSVLETRGAVFGVRMGYERPLYFDSTYNRKLML